MNYPVATRQPPRVEAPGEVASLNGGHRGAKTRKSRFGKSAKDEDLAGSILVYISGSRPFISLLFDDMRRAEGDSVRDARDAGKASESHPRSYSGISPLC